MTPGPPACPAPAATAAAESSAATPRSEPAPASTSRDHGDRTPARSIARPHRRHPRHRPHGAGRSSSHGHAPSNERPAAATKSTIWSSSKSTTGSSIRGASTAPPPTTRASRNVSIRSTVSKTSRATCPRWVGTWTAPHPEAAAVATARASSASSVTAPPIGPGPEGNAEPSVSTGSMPNASAERSAARRRPAAPG